MRGAAVRYIELGRLLKEGRERKGLSLNVATSLLGLTDACYLSRCEHGTNNFPAAKLKRALTLYKIPVSDAIEKAVEDYRVGLRRMLK